MSLPNEILRMILKFLLLSARSVQIPTLGSLSSGYRAKLSAQVLRTCQRMYLQGRQLLYTHNIFNVEHYIFPFMSEYHSQCRRDGHCACDIRTYCPIPPSYLAMIKHFEIDMVKPEYYQARIEHNRVSVIVRRALAVLSHLPDLDSIRIIIEGRYEQNKSFIGSRLGMPAEYGPYLRRHIWSGGQDGWAAAKVAEDNYEADWIIVQYCAILLAQTFRQHAPQYQYMYLALRPSGGESINKRLELNLIMHRSRGDIRSYTMHKQRGFIYVSFAGSRFIPSGG